MKINNEKELANFKIQGLSERFWKMGIMIKQRANGITLKGWKRKAVKSISEHITFDEDVDDPDKNAKIMEVLAESVYHNVMKNKCLYRTVTIAVRFNFSISQMRILYPYGLQA